MKEIVYIETSFISLLVASPSRNLVMAGNQQVTLDWESKDCPMRLAVDQLDTPFDYTLTLRRESGTVTVKPDLPETFAYLIGLHTRRRFRTERDGASAIAGHHSLDAEFKNRMHGGTN